MYITYCRHCMHLFPDPLSKVGMKFKVTEYCLPNRGTDHNFLTAETWLHSLPLLPLSPPTPPLSLVLSCACAQLLTDRFAQAQDPSSPCSDLSTYCGGTFQGIIHKLDYIQGLGANAIWISPIPVQTPNGYHGYWQMDINNVNPHFGTESDLQELVNECHSRGMWVMLDV